MQKVILIAAVIFSFSNNWYQIISTIYYRNYKFIWNHKKLYFCKLKFKHGTKIIWAREQTQRFATHHQRLWVISN